MKNRSIWIILCALWFCVSCEDEPLNQAPVCQFVTPIQGEQILYGTPLYAEIDANDTDGTITQVMLYVDNREIGIRTEAPYGFYIPVSRLSVGVHMLKAIAYDDKNTPCQSNISIKVNAVPIEVPKYAIGDYYEQGTIRGIVYSISADSTHGMILSIEEGWDSWATTSAANLQTYSTHSNNGLANYNTININFGFSAFPAVQWAHLLNSEDVTGWYLPAKNELLAIYEVSPFLQNTLISYGASPLGNGVYWSSTESSPSECWAVDFNQGVAYTRNKCDSLKIRAIKAF